MATLRPGNRIRLRGMSLIELMVALGIGMFLIIGALTVFAQSRATYALNESVARLQEASRYFFDVVEPDIRMAHYWGLTTETSLIDGRAQAQHAQSPLSPANDCGRNWTVNLDLAVAGSNNGYVFSCPAYGSAAASADTLVVRRASTAPVTAPAANTLYIASSRADGAVVFEGPASPEDFSAAVSATHELIVNGYYVSRNSSLDSPGNPVPSLRRKHLRNGGATGPAIVDEEVLPGVEDMQIEFGIDTDSEGATGFGVVDRYLGPDEPLLDPSHAAFDEHARILAVRVWLRLRSERPEPGVAETAGYSYADQTTAAFNDGYRRIVVSKTIYLRNAGSSS
ncbi:MAG TPA: PilW family protein [Gammaproteobacteria bacterium]|jgi:type IV pilus assembly protein PilW